MQLKRLSPLLAILLLCIATPALAASSLDVLDRQQRQEPPTPKSLPPMRIQEDKGQPVYDKGVRFTLGSLKLEGTTVFPAEEMLAPYAALTGTQAGFAQIERIAQELTKKYRDNGYLLSRVVLPAQEVEPLDAHIRLTAVEGFIADIEYAGDEAFVARFKNYFSAADKRLRASRPLQHAAFEREMLLLQDLPGVKVSSHFKEAAVSGGSILVLEIQRDMADGSLNWGNTGTDSSGPGLASASFSLNTLPFIGSRTTVSYTQADTFYEYFSWQIGHSHQFSNGLTMDAAYAQSKSPDPDSEFARAFDYETRSKTFTVGLDYPLIRGRDMNLSLGVGYEHRDSNARLLNARYTTDRLRNLSATVNFDVADEWGGVTQVIPTLTQGLGALRATDRDEDSASPMAPAQFIRANVYLSRNQQLPKNFSLLTAAELQVSDSPLASYNLFSLGGGQFGRGYDPGVIEGDNGFGASIEPRWTYQITDTVAVQPFAFWDWGSVWTSRSVDGARDEENLSSAGFGVRFWGHVGHEILPDFNISFFVGKPLKKAGGDHTTERFVVQAALLF